LQKETPCYEMLYRASDLAGPSKHGNELWGFMKGGEFD